MHRVRQSIIYYKEYGWDVEIVAVYPQYISIEQDKLLLDTLPPDIKIHYVDARPNFLTKLFRLNSVAFRSIFYYNNKVSDILKNNRHDLVFFSTTAIQLSILGRYWKYKFKIPYVIDMQDPWRSDHYFQTNYSKRPPRFMLSYILDMILENITMRKVDGLISVSQSYIDVLYKRYRNIRSIPSAVIPFAAYPLDIEVAKNHNIKNDFFTKDNKCFNIVYIGRAGHDMELANEIFLKAIKYGLERIEAFKNIKVYFIGTSYDKSPNAIKTVEPISKKLQINTYVYEQTQRIPYFDSLKVLSDASLLFIPGSDNIGYSASKIYSYAYLKIPILTLFHSSSSVNNFMTDCNLGLALQFDKKSEMDIINDIVAFIDKAINNQYHSNINFDNFNRYTSSYQVEKQTKLFNKVIEK